MRVFNKKEVLTLKWILSHAPHNEQENDLFEKVQDLHFVEIEKELNELRSKTWEDKCYLPSEKLIALKCYLSNNVRRFRRTLQNIQGLMIKSNGGQFPYLNAHITRRRPGRK